jgi:hypothetical protein
MTTEQVKEMATKMATSGIGYCYDSARLNAICEAGLDGIPEGAVIAQQGEQKLYRVGNTVECRKEGKVTRVTPLDGDMAGKAVAMYAHLVSRKGYVIGTI